MKEIEFFKNQIKSLNLNFLSDVSRNFIPETTGNFLEDIKFFSSFWKKVKIEKNILKVEKKINKNNIKEINEFCNITKKFFLSKYSVMIYRIIYPTILTLDVFLY